MRELSDVPGHEDVSGSGDIAPSFLTPALDENAWSASRPGCLTPKKESRLYLLHMRLGVPQSRSGHCRKETIPYPCRESNPDSSAVSRCYTDWAVSAHVTRCGSRNYLTPGLNEYSFRFGIEVSTTKAYVDPYPCQMEAANSFETLVWLYDVAHPARQWCPRRFIVWITAISIFEDVMPFILV
jgi:hypothetical protein